MRKTYPKGIKISDLQMAELNLRTHPTQPARNYDLIPR